MSVTVVNALLDVVLHPEMLKPNELAHNISFVDFSKLARLGYTHAILDLDNSLTLPKSLIVLASGLNNITKAHQEGELEDISIVSNLIVSRSDAAQQRLARLKVISSIFDAYPIPCYGKDAKPNSQGYEQAMEKMGSTKDNTFVIGDQMLTDIYGGNCLGLYTILTKPLGPDPLTTRWKRPLEHYLFRRLQLAYPD